MLTELVPKAYAVHRSLPLLGGVLDDFDDWMIQQGYRFFTRQCYILRCTAIEGYFRRRGPRSFALLTPEKLEQCRIHFGVTASCCFPSQVRRGLTVNQPLAGPRKRHDNWPLRQGGS